MRGRSTVRPDEAERTGRSIRAVLINDHVVTEEQLTEASADAYGIATLDLVGYPMDPAAATKIPMALVLKHRVLGIALKDNEITVGITDPGDVLALDDVRAATGLLVRPVVVARSELRCAPTPTWCSSARSATAPPRNWRSRPRSPATWCSRPSNDAPSAPASSSSAPRRVA